jgi:hypothetical protein
MKHVFIAISVILLSFAVILLGLAIQEDSVIAKDGKVWVCDLTAPKKNANDKISIRIKNGENQVFTVDTEVPVGKDMTPEEKAGAIKKALEENENLTGKVDPSINNADESVLQLKPCPGWTIKGACGKNRSKQKKICFGTLCSVSPGAEFQGCSVPRYYIDFTLADADIIGQNPDLDKSSIHLGIGGGETPIGITIYLTDQMSTLEVINIINQELEGFDREVLFHEDFSWTIRIKLYPGDGDKFFFGCDDEGLTIEGGFYEWPPE